MGWYENTLGNAVILAHENDLLTVYGNLEEIIIPESQESTIITKAQSSICSPVFICRFII
jgi:hypothetical protein